MSLRLRVAGALALLVVVGCGSSGQAPGGSSTGASSVGGGGAGGGGGSGELAVALPQAVEGAMLVNPTVYDEVPLRVASKAAESVAVKLGDTDVPASDDDGDGVWIARLPVKGLAEGSVTVRATASAGADSVSAEAELVVANAGVQLTDFKATGLTGTPRIHRVGTELWLTHTDRSEPDAEAWLRRIDGAGRFVGERIKLVDSPLDTLYARCAIGTERIGVLYQQPGSPYKTYFKITDHEGSETLAPVALDPPGWFGSWGGDLAYDGESFLVVWRVNDGMGGGEVRWARFAELDGTMTGPTVVASAGPGTAAEPTGKFDPFSFVGVDTVAGKSVVSFVRGYYEKLIDFENGRAQVGTVQNADGALAGVQFAGGKPGAQNLRADTESRVFRAGDTLLSLWAGVDLTDNDIPVWFWGKQSDASGAIEESGPGTLVLKAVDQRDEPFFLAHPSPDYLGVLAWMDHRSYTIDGLDKGKIDLYVAPVDGGLALVEPATVLRHVQLYAGLGQINAALLGTNAGVIWLDWRNGKPEERELFFETVWY